MLKMQSAVVGLLIACLMSSCIPSKHPLSAPETARHDKCLTGAWVGADPEGGGGVLWIHFVETEDSLTQVVLVDPAAEGTDVELYRMHSTTIGEHTYMNLKRRIREKSATADMLKDIKSDDYIFAKYEVSDDILKIWLMATGIDDAMKQGELAGTSQKGIWNSDITITDTPEKIRKFLQKADHAEVFIPLMVCRKVDVEPPNMKGFRGME